jgi:autotransporter translocation and assembly factor TamB
VVQHLSVQARPASVDIHTLQGALQVQAGQLRIEDLRLQTARTLITGAGVLPGKTRATNLALQTQPLDLAELGRLLQHDAFQGLVHLALQAQGPPEALAVTSQLRLAQGQVRLHGHINTVATPPRYSGTFDVTSLDLATLIARATLQSDLNLRLQLDGQGLTPQALRGQALLDIYPSHLGNIALRPSQIQLEARQQRVEVQRLHLDTAVAQMTMTGAIDLAGRSDLQYQLAADLSQLRQLLGTEAVDGEVQVQGQAAGELTAISAQGTVQARRLRYQEHHLEGLTLTYTGRELGAQPAVTIQAMARQARLGTFPVEHLEMQAAYEAAAQQVRFATEVRQSSLHSGTTRGTLTLDGTNRQVLLEDLRLRLADRTWQAAAPIEVAFGARQVSCKQCKLVHANESLELAGTLDGERLQDVRFQASQIDLTALRRVVSLPEPLQGRVTLQVHLAGTLPEPVLQGELTLSPDLPSGRPRPHLHAALAYAHRQVQSQVRVQQANRDVLALQLRLPIDLALAALPLEQRLYDEALALHVQIERPELAVLQHWWPQLPAFPGMVRGEVAVQGTLAALDLKADLQLQEFGVQSIVERVTAPLRLTATVVPETSLSELAQAVAQGRLAPRLQQLEVRIPTLQAQLLTGGDGPQRVQLGDLLAQAEGQWTREGIQATLRTLRFQASAFGLPRAHLTLAARVTPQHLELTRLHARLPQSEVQGHGTLAWARQHVQLHLEVPRLRLDELVPAFPATLPLELRGVLETQGTPQALQLAARLQYANAQVEADIVARLQERLPHYNATIRIDRLAMARLLPQMPGQLRALLQVQGVGFAPAQRRADLDMRVDTSGFPLAPGLTTHLRASLDGNAVRLTTLRAQSVPGTLEARGTLSAQRQVALSYALTLSDLRALQDSLGVPLHARGGSTGEIRGTLPALQARGSVQLDTWEAAGLQGKGLRATFSAANLLSTPQATVKVHLAELQGPALPASALSLQGEYQAPRGTFTVAMTAGPYAQTRLAGSVVWRDGLQLTLARLRLQRQELVWENASPVEVQRDAQGVLHVSQFFLRSGPQQIRGRGTLTPAGVIDATMQLQRVQIQPPLRVLAPSAAIPEGQLTADLTLRGTLKQPQMAGTLALTALRWQDQAFGAIQARFETVGEALQADVRWHEQTRELLHVHGTLGLGGSGTLAVQVQASVVDMARLALLIPVELHSAGTLQLDLQLVGTLAQPRVYGALTLQDGRLQLATTGERYRDIQVQLDFAGDRVEIRRLQVGSRSGALQLSGRLVGTDLAHPHLDVFVQADNFTAMHTPDIEAVVSAALALRGSWQDLSATGRITVPRARVGMTGKLWGGPADVEPWQLTVPGVYGPGPEAVTNADGQLAAAQNRLPWPFLRADLTVNLPRNVWVQGTGTAIETRGTMHITKALQEPFILDGTIETVRGYASFYGKKFVVQEGKVTFPGAEEINPFLDVIVTHAVSGYIVSIQVGGKAKQPTLTLSSTPELPQAEIVSLLVIGKTTDRLTSSEQNALAGQVQKLVGGLAAGELEGLLGKPLGLDTIEVQTGETLGTGRISVGRYVTQDLFLSYERQIGEESGNKVGVEYSINRRLKLKGSGSDTGESALDLIWRLDY